MLYKREKEKETIQIPLCVLNERPLGILEILVKYLHEELKLKFIVIAKLLNRDNRAVWATYKAALKKKKSRFIVDKIKPSVPVSIFTKRKFGVLELLVVYLKDSKKYSIKQISEMLQRSDRTIWTTYNRAKQKR